MEYGCRNKVVVISGGTSGIGLAAARAFWKDGAAVSIVGRDSAKGMIALAAIAGCKDPEAAVFPGLPEGTDTLSAALMTEPERGTVPCRARRKSWQGCAISGPM